MSIIQDALKKAQQERKKKHNREIPYHLSGVQKKPKTIIIYVIVGFCVAAVFAWLFIPYFHKPKQITRPVVAQAPAPVSVNVAPILEAQKLTREISAKKGESATAPVPQKPIEKPALSVTPNIKQETAGAKTRIAQIQKIAISPPVERETRVAGTAGKED